MALADALKIETAAASKGPRCSMCQLAERLDVADRMALDAALADDAILTTVIARALKRDGHDVSTETVRRHRKGECKGRKV